MKKKLIAGLVTVLSISINIQATFANTLIDDSRDDEVHLSENISPMMTYISSSRCGLSISSTGTASTTSSVIGIAGVSKTEIKSNLQQYKNGKWITIATWSSSGSRSCTLSKSSSVSKGYSYRVSSNVKAYKGSLSESKTISSSTVSY